MGMGSMDKDLFWRRGVDVDNIEHVELEVPVEHPSNCI